ncbi:sensor domain-containing diguanylate cyclase [Novosphingobium album (ex Hu et al. 2023)]|uniref:GGDEF domain-containing protein n=1 Tax=Novosphingobium album (ex Hu et al. 2023) TaxID=2930093 RepID=A0ABT0B655_9SPHN|nr:GGDEF domain-containing protein [Novosphingobium album (ex Hu et al. 2023)]MCJ2180545.1 GGDEF domain-containing protein [Novosphingobium album (ex Hu et al. 2023)]
MPGSSAESLTDRVYIEQVRSLYLHLLPAVAMWAAFALTFWLAFRRTPEPGWLLLGVAGLAASSLRIGLTIIFRDMALTGALDRPKARRLEIIFALPYFVFALVLGLLGALIFRSPVPEIHMLTICVIVGYCAGTATSCGLRPRLAIASMLAAVGPPILVSVFIPDPAYLAMAFIATSFVLGGARSILVRFEVAKAEIARRMVSISLARRDVLTTLPNRLALQEYFDENAVLISPHRPIAVHYLDLDGFKPVNDRYGHATGDALLLAIADRLRGAIRSGDLVARIGGDEFAIIQFSLHHADEAALLVRRIIAAIEQPFIVEGHSLTISASIGTVVSHDRHQPLESLLKAADARLYELKQARRHSIMFAMIA